MCTGLRYFQSVELSLNRSVIDVQELICRSHHVDPVGLAVLRIILCKRHSANVAAALRFLQNAAPRFLQKSLTSNGRMMYTSGVYMGEFPSGQRGQTVNLLALPSVVQIHLPPPENNRYSVYNLKGFDRNK